MWVDGNLCRHSLHITSTMQSESLKTNYSHLFRVARCDSGADVARPGPETIRFSAGHATKPTLMVSFGLNLRWSSFKTRGPEKRRFFPPPVLLDAWQPPPMTCRSLAEHLRAWRCFWGRAGSGRGDGSIRWSCLLHQPPI